MKMLVRGVTLKRKPRRPSSNSAIGISGPTLLKIENIYGHLTH
jgi:hypothetical protein